MEKVVMIRMIYPDERWVKTEQIISWANDTVANAKLDGVALDFDGSLEDVIDLLQSEGTHTFSN